MSKKWRPVIGALIVLGLVWWLWPRPTPAPRPEPQLPVAKQRAEPTPPPRDRKDMPVADETQLPFDGTEAVLPNGVRVAVVEDHSEPVVAVVVSVDVGGAMDPPGKEGMAHLVEHLMFQGSTRMGALDYPAERLALQELDALRADGASDDELRAAHRRADALAAPGELAHVASELGVTGLNAWTSVSQTAFEARVPSNRLDQWLEVEADRFREPVFRRFINTTQVVMQEQARRHHHGGSTTPHLLRELLFDGQAYGRSLAGTPATIEGITMADAEGFFERWYTPSQLSVVLVGDVGTGDAWTLLEETFGAIPPARSTPAPPAPPVQARSGARGPGAGPRTIAMAWPLFDLEPGELEALEVSTMAIRNGPIEHVFDVKATIERLGSAAMYRMRGVCTRNDNPRGCERSMLDRVRARMASGASLEGSAKRFEVELLRSLEEPLAHARAISMHVHRGEAVAAFAEHIRWLRGTTREQVQEAMKRHLSGPPVVLEAGELPLLPTPSRLRLSSDDDEDVLSTFAHTLLTAEVTPLPPQWRVEGKHYSVAEEGRVIAVHNPKNHVFELDVLYPVGWADQPLLCYALLRMEVLWKRGWGLEARKEGVGFDSACGPFETRLTLDGPGYSIGPAVAVLGRALAEAEVGPIPQVVAQSLVGLALPRRSAEHYARYGRETPYRVAPSKEVLERATESQMQAAVRSLLSVSPTVLSSGHLDADWLSRLVPGLGAAVPGRPMHAVPPASMTLVVSNPRPAVTMIRTTPCAPAYEGFWALYDAWMVGQAGRPYARLREAQGLTYTPSTTIERCTTIESSDVLRIQASTRRSRDLLPLARSMVSVATEVSLDEESWTRIRETALARHRTGTISFRKLPAALRAFRERGIPGDARELTYRQLLEIDQDSFEAFLTELAKRPSVLLVEGAVDSRQQVELSKLGELRRVDDATLRGR